MKMNNRWNRFIHLLLSILPCSGLCIEEALSVLRPDGRITAIDATLPDEDAPSALKIVLNATFTLLGIDLNRRWSDIIRAVEAFVDPNETTNGD